MGIDFTAFRKDGAIVASTHISMLEVGDRVNFKRAMAASDPQRALDSSNSLLAADYASVIGHFDAMMACRALRKTDEAAQHEKILNALLDSVAASGDGKMAETSYFAATTQEEYIFLALRLNVKPKGESLITNNGHFYDRLEVVDPKTNLTRYVWFNADVQMNPAGKASADVSATPASSAGPVEIASEKPPSPPASATTHYTPPDDGIWSRQMNIEVTRTPGADKDHVVVQFTVPDASARFVSPGDKALQFNLIKIYGSRMQWGSRTDIPSGILAWPTGDWKPGDRVTLEFDLPKQFTSAVDGWSLRFCVGTAARCLPSPICCLTPGQHPRRFGPNWDGSTPSMEKAAALSKGLPSSRCLSEAAPFSVTTKTAASNTTIFPAKEPSSGGFWFAVVITTATTNSMRWIPALCFSVRMPVAETCHGRGPLS